MSASTGDIKLDMSLDNEKGFPQSYHHTSPAQSKSSSSSSVWSRGLKILVVLVLLGIMCTDLLDDLSESMKRHRGGHRHRGGKHGGHHRKPGHLSPTDAEKLFLTLPDPEQIREYSRSYTSFAHYSGTPGDLHSAKITEKRWSELLGVESAGILESGTHEAQEAIRGLPTRQQPTVHVDTYHTLLNYPLGNSSLSMTSSNGTEVFKAKLFEPPVEGDKTSQNGTADVPLFHGYSKPGSASGQLVYANQGRREDYEALKQQGIDLKGKIAMVRYGGTFRGLKISAGELYGIAGVIIYTDPAEDGDITEANGYKAYPDGPARQPLSVQRGSVQKLASYSGDPLTPGYPAYQNASRLPRDAPGLNLVGVPSLPLSWAEALPLLQTLVGKGEKIDDWQGGLTAHGLEYFTGPSEGTVHLNNQVAEDIKPLWNVYATIPGMIQDEVIVLGNHRDAWTYGAGDPNSGSSSMDEIVRSFSVLLQKGWKPFRPIIIASWDGEEYGLLGSTEFGEDFADFLKSKSAVYINVDVAAAGSIMDLAASPSLATLYKNVTSYVDAPDEPGKKLSDYLKGDGAIRSLGSGSDFTVFLQHLGIAASDISFRRSHKDPVYHYHSIYDSEFWMEKYGDPSFKRHAAVSKVLGLATLRFADSPILPLSVSDYAHELLNYATDLREKTAHTTPVHGVFENLDFDELDKAVAKVASAAKSLHQEAQEVAQVSCPRRKYLAIRSINQRLAKFEGAFLDDEGLPGRSWFKHLGVAPGRWQGYGSAVFPGLTEAITLDQDGHAADIEMYRLLRALDRAERLLQK